MLLRTIIALSGVYIVSIPPAARLHAQELQAGVAVVDITPPTGYRMAGYFNERFNTGTHDPLQAKALVLRQGDFVRAALVFCDLVGITREVSERARELAAKKTGISAANILIAATHSHTGPLYDGAMRQYFHDRAIADKGSDPHEKIDYAATLAAKIAEAIDKAAHSTQPVTLSAGVARQEGLSFNRRFHMKDGTVLFNPGKLNPNIIRPAGPIDPDVGLLRFRAGDKDLALLTVFALHLDTVGGTEYSADFPFHLERKLRQALGEAVSLFGAGTCGDINHINVSNRDPQKGQLEAGRIGTTLAETVQEALPKLKPQRSPRLAISRTLVPAPLQKYSAEAIAQARQDMAKIGSRDMPFLKQVETVKIVSLQMLPKETLPMEVQVFRLSNDVAIVGLPGEIFVDLGQAIKKASPFPITLVIELCNDVPGYVPTIKAFKEGSYETVNSRVQPGGGEKLVEAATRLLKELGDSRRP